MGKPIDYAQVAKVHQALGGSQSATAKHLGVHRGTVREALRRAGLLPAQQLPQPTRPSQGVEAPLPETRVAAPQSPTSKPAAPPKSAKLLQDFRAREQGVWKRHLERLEVMADALVDQIEDGDSEAVDKLQEVWESIGRHLQIGRDILEGRHEA